MKVSRGSATGATTTEVCATGLHLDEDRRFSIKLEETFDVEMVRNDDKCYFFVIKHDFNYFNV